MSPSGRPSTPSEKSAAAPTSGSRSSEGTNLPRRLGPYTLFDFIGKGGMAEIYLARVHTDLGAVRLCVVKQILPQLSEQKAFADMLAFEAKLASRLSHANVVQVYELGREGEHLFIAMEYVEGLDLNQLLGRCTRAKVSLPTEFALGIVAEALKGLEHAHRRTDEEGKALGIVHRDVSPSNVLVSFEGEVKLCDFGIAKAHDLVEEKATDDESIKGKAGYMSPEQANGGDVSARSDVFSAGILLWELVSGHRLYKPSSDVPLLEQARRAEITEPKERELPEQAELNALIMKALSRDPEMRQATAGELLRDLESYMQHAKLVMSPLKLGEWMSEHFGAEILSQRRSREQALSAHSLPPMPASGNTRSAEERKKIEEPPSSLVAATMDVQDADKSDAALEKKLAELDEKDRERKELDRGKVRRIVLFAAALVVVIVLIFLLSKRQ